MGSILKSIGTLFSILIFAVPALSFELSPEEAVDVAASVMADCQSPEAKGLTSLTMSLKARPGSCSADIHSSEGSKTQDVIAEEERVQSFFQSLSLNNLDKVLSDFLIFSQRFGNPIDKDALVKEICSEAQKCSETEKTALQERVSKTLDALQRDPNFASAIAIQSVTDRLNGRLLLLNSLLKDVEAAGVDITINLFSNSPRLREAAMEKFQVYTQACLDNLNTPTGAILRTDALMDGVGKCRVPIKNEVHGMTQEGFFASWDRKPFLFVPHQELTVKQVQSAIDGRKATFLESIKSSLSEFRMFHSPEISRKKGVSHDRKTGVGQYSEGLKLGLIARAVTSDSSALQDALLQDPYQSALVCKAGDWMEKQAAKQKRIKALSKGLFVASMATGLGSIAMLAGGVALRGLVTAAALRGSQVGTLSVLKAGGIAGLNTFSQGLLTVSGYSASAASVFSIIELPTLVSIERTEQESLSRLQTVAFEKAMNGVLTAGDLRAEGLQQEVIRKNRSLLIWTAVLLPIDGLIVASQLGNVARSGGKGTGGSSSSGGLVDEFSQASPQERLNILNPKKTQPPISNRRDLEVIQPAVVRAKAFVDSVLELIKVHGLTAKQTEAFMEALNPKRIKNMDVVESLLGKLNPGRLKQTEDSPLIFGFALRVLSQFQKGTTQALKAAHILNTWNDGLISGISVMYHKALQLRAYIPGLSKTEAVDRVLKSQGAGSETITGLRKCLI